MSFLSSSALFSAKYLAPGTRPSDSPGVMVDVDDGIASNRSGLCIGLECCPPPQSLSFGVKVSTLLKRFHNILLETYLSSTPFHLTFKTFESSAVRPPVIHASPPNCISLRPSALVLELGLRIYGHCGNSLPSLARRRIHFVLRLYRQ
jgi:hypothetical protein